MADRNDCRNAVVDAYGVQIDVGDTVYAASGRKCKVTYAFDKAVIVECENGLKCHFSPKGLSHEETEMRDSWAYVWWDVKREHLSIGEVKRRCKKLAENETMGEEGSVQ